MNEVLNVPHHIFRSYDIRGVGDRDLTDPLVYRIGIVLGERMKAAAGTRGRWGVGRDSRLSSPRIFRSLCAGIRSTGAEVVELGEVATPITYFAHYQFDLDGVIQITASHNPKDDNGMKMVLKKNTLFGDEIRSIGTEAAQMPADLKMDFSLANNLPSIASELRTKYLQFLRQQFSFSKTYSVAVDCGNGMLGDVAREALSPFCSKLDILYEEVDCRFPHHEADPTVLENLKDLQAQMKKNSYDFGFAFDGDGDRLGLITSSGRVLWGDEILMLLSELVLKELPGSTIIGEVKCSEKLFRHIREKGGTPLMYRTGHSLIKKKMKELGSPLAGEMSGHLFFADRFFGYDDALYAAFRVIEVVDRLKISLDDWVSTHPSSFVTPEIRVECLEEEKEGLVSQAKKLLSALPGVKIFDIDGVRVTYADGAWALVRASNTQAVLVVRVEAPSSGRREEVLKSVESALGRKVNYV